MRTWRNRCLAYHSTLLPYQGLSNNAIHCTRNNDNNGMLVQFFLVHVNAIVTNVYTFTVSMPSLPLTHLPITVDHSKYFKLQKCVTSNLISNVFPCSSCRPFLFTWTLATDFITQPRGVTSCNCNGSNSLHRCMPSTDHLTVFSPGDTSIYPHLIHGPTYFATKWHHDQFSCFCRAHPHGQHRHT